MPSTLAVLPKARTVPNSPMTAWALLLRVVVTIPRILLFGRKGWIQDEQLTAEQIRDRYDRSSLTPALNASLRLVGKCLSLTASSSGLHELAAYRLLQEQPRNTGDPEYDCIMSDAIVLMQMLLPEDASDDGV